MSHAPDPLTRRRSALTGGVALMVLATGAFTTMAALVKSLGPGFPHFEAAFFRGLLALPMMFWLMRRRRIALWPRRPALAVGRGLLGLGGMGCFFYAMQRGKLADMLIISRFQPILIAILSPLLLGERAPRAALMALAAGFGGVLLVARPGMDVASVAGMVAFASTLFSSLAHMSVRRLNATEPPQRIVTWFSLVITVGGLALSLPQFVWPDAGQLLKLIGMALSATVGQLLMTTAYARDTAPVVSTATYSFVVYGVVFGLLFWGEVPDLWAVSGALVIVVSGVWLAWQRR